MSYTTTTKFKLVLVEEGESTFDFADYMNMTILISGTAYFTVLEVIQMRALKLRYLKLANLCDIVYLVINFCFIADLFTSYMSHDTATLLKIAQTGLMGFVFFNWLRVFESFVIFIRLIK